MRVGRFEFFATGFVLGVIVGAGILGALLSHDWKLDAINNGVGEYNPQTGEFQWKQSE